MRCLWLCFFILTLSACHSSQVNNKISIHLSVDSQRIIVSGLDYNTLQQLRSDSLTTEAWQALYPVYRIPVDTTMKYDQPEQPGVYTITDSLVTFKPDTAFKKQQSYFARFFGDGSNFSTGNLIRGKSNLKGIGFVEVVFKF